MVLKKKVKRKVKFKKSVERVRGERRLTTNVMVIKHGGLIKMRRWLCVEKECYLGFGNRVGMRKIGRNIVGQKKMLRE